MAVSKPHRHRSSSDPFSDPPAISYSSYGVPTLASYQQPQQQQRRAPPVPPKAPAKTSTSHRAKPTMATEVVTTTRSTSDQPRNRVGRSQTQVSPYVYKSLPSRYPTFSQSIHASLDRPMAVRPAPPPARRSLSQDSVAQQAAADKAKSSSRRNGPQKKGSSHADVIDRLDFSGVGGPSASHFLSFLNTVY